MFYRWGKFEKGRSKVSVGRLCHCLFSEITYLQEKISRHPKCLSILQISALSPSWFHLFATELVDNGWQWLAVVDNSWQWLAMVGNGKPLCFRACWQSRRAEKYSPPAPAYSSSETPANWQLKFHLHQVNIKTRPPYPIEPNNQIDQPHQWPGSRSSRS